MRRRGYLCWLKKRASERCTARIGSPRPKARIAGIARASASAYGTNSAPILYRYSTAPRLVISGGFLGDDFLRSAEGRAGGAKLVHTSARPYHGGDSQMLTAERSTHGGGPSAPRPWSRPSSARPSCRPCHPARPGERSPRASRISTPSLLTCDSASRGAPSTSSSRRRLSPSSCECHAAARRRSRPARTPA